MKVEFWTIGKTNEKYLVEGMAIFQKRIRRYLKMETVLIPDVKSAKNLSPPELKKKEGEKILAKLKAGDFLILLDEKGKTFTSVKFAKYLEKQLQQSHQRIIFLIGGAYGFSEAVYQRANQKLSLSDMTFSHQMIRVFFLEQFYRAMTILRGEPYHNE
ncbi:MAG: 23S rRNA (pseudouridine(1915)-N(3))-methyltransferase RlmH [Bacteroidota bacterium]